MALNNRLVNWTNFIQFTSSGIVVADYPEIRKSLATRFKEIYGDDIDLSTGTADGVYIETLALIINNQLQSIRQFYASLDIRTASGKYLEQLCALTNVSRKPATYSTASLSVTLTNEASYTTSSISFKDVNGNVWTYTAPNGGTITFRRNQAKSIVVTCETIGPIAAQPGWIDSTVDTSIVMTIEQTDAAALGSYEETDTQLRARRNESLGASGMSVLESLAGALLNLVGVDDVKIYNNDTLNTMTSQDNTSIPTHSIYVVVRYADNADIDDSTIGSLIYEKLTPGIHTTQPGSNVGSLYKKSYQYVQYILGQPISSDVPQMVYWKKAAPECPNLELYITPLTNFASDNDETCLTIFNNLCNYLRNLPISSNVTEYDLRQVIEASDPLFRGQRTFRYESVTIGGLTSYQLADNYFDNYYSEQDIQIEYITTGEHAGQWHIETQY